MAKVTKVKSRVVSTHSRAARRAASPSIDTDKSLKEVDPPEDTTQPDDVLAARKGSGVTKKKYQKPLTRQQRLRKEKGVARAEAVVDQLENKVVKSKSSARVIKSRAADWEDLNGTGASKKKDKKKNQLDINLLAEDDAMEDIVDADPVLGTETPDVVNMVLPASATQPQAMTDVDQIT